MQVITHRPNTGTRKVYVGDYHAEPGVARAVYAVAYPEVDGQPRYIKLSFGFYGRRPVYGAPKEPRFETLRMPNAKPATSVLCADDLDALSLIASYLSTPMPCRAWVREITLYDKQEVTT